MYCYIDLRYALPPLVNMSFLLLTSPTDSWDKDHGFISKILQYPVLVILLFVVAILILLLLFTSIALPFIVQPVRLQIGNFSGHVATMLLVAIIFSPPLFWFLYLVLIITSPWHRILCKLFKCIVQWFYHNLRSIPPLIIVCITQRRRQSPAPAAHRDQVQVEVVDIEDDHAVQDNVNRD